MVGLYKAYSSIPTHAMKVAAAAQMRELDRRAEEKFGVPSIVLMENAGRHVALEVQSLLGSALGKKVSIVCGKGNNGGDGFVAARHLLDAGVDSSVYLLSDPDDVKGDAAVNLRILLESGASVTSVESSSELLASLRASDVVVDAIFGTGLSGEVRGLPKEAINAINDARRPVVAVDVPSGLDSDTGRVLGDCVRADCTVTFALPKIGLVSYPGVWFVGRLVVADIGIPHHLYESIAVELTGEDWIAAHLPPRPPDAHKGTFGTGLVIAGSSGMTGAAALAAEAVLRVGAGLSILAIPSSLQDLMAMKLTEVMTRGLPETETRSLASAAVQPARELCEKASAVVLGCGIGTYPETRSFVREFVTSAKLPLLVDADGLNCLAEDSSVLEGAHADLVITPHPGEMGRLLGTSASDVESDRIDAARQAASRFNCVAVLKGARTVIADPSGYVFLNPTGNAGMATGGTGDVLAGAIGGLLAQGLGIVEAAVCGTFVHGLAGDIATEEIGEAGLIAGDVLGALPLALKELYG